MIQVLLNDDELVEALAQQMILRHMRKMRPDFVNTDTYVAKCTKQWRKARELNLDFGQIRDLITRDLRLWRDDINHRYKKLYRPCVRWLQDNRERLGISRDLLLLLTAKCQHQTFSQKVANCLDSNITLQTRDSAHQLNKKDQWLIRNVLDNETLLQTLMQGKRDFWFVDSGYTNFLTGKKTWHRLVKNHVHHRLARRYFPADRLKLLPSLPHSWRSSGHDILVVESSQNHHMMFGTTQHQWQQNIKAELAKHTDRTVYFKEKTASRKDRVSVHELLSEDPDRWYCVISDSSAAAIEAIWLGIPVITLGQHISTPVARTRISDINNLYRGPIGDWLCALSYSQFTSKEITNGTARSIMEQYHGA